MNSQGNSQVPPAKSSASGTKLQNGIFHPIQSLYFGGTFYLGRLFGWAEQQILRCSLELAQQVDAVLTTISKEGPASLPNHLKSRRLLIESGSRYALGSVEPRFTESDAAVCAAVYYVRAGSTRPWVPCAQASNWHLAALAALLLEGNDSGGVNLAPPPGEHRFAAAVLYGCPPQTRWNGLHLSADVETEFEAETFPEALLDATNVLARRIISDDERAAWQEVA